MNEIEFPYLDRKISSDSLEYAKENIWYHLLPYIVAQTDNELQGYKSIISLSLQSSILDELKTQQDKIQYKINALKNRKLNKYLFDLYLYEHQFYEANGGDDTVLMGYTLRDIETILRKDASILILIYFRILNLLRLAKYAPKKYSINRSSKMVYNLHTASDTNEITRCFWSYDKIEKSWQKYKSVGHIIYGYVQTLVDHNILDLNLNFTTSTNISTIISDYNEYDSFIDSILGYLLAQGSEINRTDIFGFNAIMSVIFNENMDDETKSIVLQILIDKGCDVNWINCQGKTALMLALERIEPDIANLLLNNGAVIYKE